jgi:tetratricopeptide (TPR) repeat protein
VTPKPAAQPPALTAALALHRQGRLDEAAAIYAALLAVEPRQPDALHLLGLVAHQQGDQAQARDCIEKALALVPESAVFGNSLGSVLLALRQSQAAAAILRRVVARKPEYAEAHNNLGNALLRLDQADAAAACYQRALALRPGYAEAESNLASALRRLGRLDDAEQALHRALALNPRYATALANLGVVLVELGRHADALAAYDRAIAIDAGHAQAHANRAVLLLQLGRWPEGWREYEWRWRTDGFTTPKRDFRQPAWDGRPLAGRSILLHAEQGLGSAIQFVRFVHRVAAGGGRILLECQAPLARLFRQSLTGGDGPVAAVVVKGEPLPPFDVHAPLMSLPLLCGTMLATLPAATPYLAAAADAVARWRQRLAPTAKPRIGLVWAGNPQHGNDHNRSMPAAALRPLIAAAPAASFFSLQVGGPAAAAADDLFAAGVHDLAPALADFAETAAVVANLDAVVSVDTAVAHLGGALGRPVMLLLPFAAEWRWLLERSDSPWYPGMRLYRQPAPGDWAGAVARVAADLPRPGAEG